TALFLGRLLAFAVATLAILALSWLGFVAAKPWSALDVGGGGPARPYVSLRGVLFFFGGPAPLLCPVLPRRPAAAPAAGAGGGGAAGELLPDHAGAPRHGPGARRPVLAPPLLPERGRRRGPERPLARGPDGGGGAVRRPGVVELRAPRHPGRRRGRLALASS